PIRDGVLVVKDQLTDNNKVVQDFYNSPLWPKFRFWEWFTFLCNGGERRSRNKILRHLPQTPHLKLLDVALGHGAYLPCLPATWAGGPISPGCGRPGTSWASQPRPPSSAPAAAAPRAATCRSSWARPRTCRSAITASTAS